jgi:uncharacterized protein
LSAEPAPKPNRLIHEKSPYLLQHAHNPVDWYPWGDEAFRAAEELNRPIFLSIGYATCHWCHVMEKESFESPEIAQLLNETFINIKVDREELPEVDSVYMEIAQTLMSSPGGWPLNVVLTPDLKAFLAVTYLPPQTRKGLMGLDQFIGRVRQLWESEEKGELTLQAGKLVELLQHTMHLVGSELPTEEQLNNSIELLLSMADPLFGGMKGEPKFPLGTQCEFLLQYAHLKNESRALYFAELTLNMMGGGGIFDHLGGGFFRYSTDAKWQLPHFEKMLYDNAILAKVYLEAWRLTKKESFKEIASETLTYLLRQMNSPEGGFYSAEDADTEGHEGLFYTWTAEEIQTVLTPELAEFFCQMYGVTTRGQLNGRSALHRVYPLEEIATLVSLPPAELEKKLRYARRALFEKRESRSHPFKDDKIITAWNGLAIDAFARAGAAWKEKRLTAAAVKAAEMIKSQLWKEGKLLRRYRDGEARFSAGLEDYAFLIKGFLALFEAGESVDYLRLALEMTALLERDFKAHKGAFYQTDSAASILVRRCEHYDGSEPSGNSVHTGNLLKLYQMTGDEQYLTAAEDVLKATKQYIESYAPGACGHLTNLMHALNPKAALVVIALDEKSSLEEEIKEALFCHFSPHTAIVWKRAGDERLSSLLPEMKEKLPLSGATALYICRQNQCEEPVSGKEAILNAIQKL